MTTENERMGYGRGRFVLGYGPGGVYGNVELVLQLIPPGESAAIQWRVPHDVMEETRRKVEQSTIDVLNGYLIAHPDVGLKATITEVRSDAERQNDYGRAVSLALRNALRQLSLPPPQMYMSPDEDPTWIADSCKMDK